MLFLCHVQGLVHPIVEKGKLPDGFLKMRAVQQVRMEEQCPPREIYPSAVVFLASYLPGGNADYRPPPVVVLAAPILQVYIRLIMKEDAIHAVVVKAVRHRRYLREVYDANKRMPHSGSYMQTIIAHIPYL